MNNSFGVDMCTVYMTVNLSWPFCNSGNVHAASIQEKSNNCGSVIMRTTAPICVCRCWGPFACKLQNITFLLFVCTFCGIFFDVMCTVTQVQNSNCYSSDWRLNIVITSNV